MRKLAIIAAFAALAGGGVLVAPSLVSHPTSQSSERNVQCRQDGQEDVTSIQLNILFNCYGADQGEEASTGDWSGDTALCTTDDECEHLFPELRGRADP